MNVYYISLSDKYEFLPHSIEDYHLESFIKCIKEESQCQEYIVNHFQEILLLSKISKLEIFLAESGKEFLSRLEEQSVSVNNPIVSAVAMPSGQLIASQSGGMNPYLVGGLVLLITAAYVKYGTKSNFINIDSVVDRVIDYDDDMTVEDQRRIIIGCEIFSSQKTYTCALKVSRNRDYINEYQAEAKIYKTFQAKSRNLPVMDFYGDNMKTTDSNSYLQIEDIHIGDDSLDMFMIRGGDEIRFDRYDRAGNRLHPNTVYYYFAMEWNPEFNSALNIWKPRYGRSKFSATKRNESIRNIISTLGELNEDYGFYHGDLKDDNVFISNDSNTEIHVKHMDFDFSGFVGDYDNSNLKVISSFFPNNRYHSGPVGNLSAGIRTGSQDVKNYLYLFDVYRLWCSIMWDIQQSGRYDTTHSMNSIEANNGSIQFSLKDFVDFFISNGDNKYPFFDQRSTSNRKITILINNIASAGIGRQNDWNRTLMDENIFNDLYNFIINK